MTETFLIEEPLFITEEIEAEMVKAGYVFEPPQHVSFQDAQVWPKESLAMIPILIRRPFVKAN